MGDVRGLSVDLVEEYSSSVECFGQYTMCGGGGGLVLRKDKLLIAGLETDFPPEQRMEEIYKKQCQKPYLRPLNAVARRQPPLRIGTLQDGTR